jgi:hypothetical protein
MRDDYHETARRGREGDAMKKITPGLYASADGKKVMVMWKLLDNLVYAMRALPDLGPVAAINVIDFCARYPLRVVRCEVEK